MTRSTCPHPEKSGAARPGAAATELALVLPLLALMFTAIVDFGRVFHTTQTLQQCASAGAVYAARTAWAPTSTGQEQAAKDAACSCGASLSPPLQPGEVTVTFTSTYATVTVEYDFELLTSALGFLGSIRLTRTVTMKIAPTPGA